MAPDWLGRGQLWVVMGGADVGMAGVDAGWGGAAGSGGGGGGAEVGVAARGSERPPGGAACRSARGTVWQISLAV